MNIMALYVFANCLPKTVSLTVHPVGEEIVCHAIQDLQGAFENLYQNVLVLFLGIENTFNFDFW